MNPYGNKKPPLWSSKASCGKLRSASTVLRTTITSNITTLRHKAHCFWSRAISMLRRVLLFTWSSGLLPKALGNPPRGSQRPCRRWAASFARGWPRASKRLGERARPDRAVPAARLVWPLDLASSTSVRSLEVITTGKHNKHHMRGWTTYIYTHIFMYLFIHSQIVRL